MSINVRNSAMSYMSLAIPNKSTVLPSSESFDSAFAHAPGTPGVLSFSELIIAGRAVPIKGRNSAMINMTKGTTR